MAWRLSDISAKFNDASDKEKGAFWPRLVTGNAGVPSEGYGFFRACLHAATYEKAELDRWLQNAGDVAPLQYAMKDRSVHRAMLAHLRCAAAAHADSSQLHSFLQEEIGREEYGGAICASYLRDLFLTFVAARKATAEELNDPASWRHTLPSVKRAEISVLLAVPGAGKGYVGTLALELVNREDRVPADAQELALYPTPLLSLLSRDNLLKNTEQAALQYVRSVIGKEVPGGVDIRWDLNLRRGERFPARLEGPSLGAAVALAMLQLLGHQQSRPLEQRLVWVAPSAVVDAQGNLSTVGEEFSKLLAAVDPLSGVNVVVMAAAQPVRDYPDFVPDPVDHRLLRRIAAADVETPQGAQFCIIKAESVQQAVDLLILYQKTRLGPPPPDDGLAPSEALRAHLATELPTALRTFDLGLVWGLDRGGFIGLTSGAEGDDLYHALLRSERALWDALGGAKAPEQHVLRDQIPIRYWVKITEPARYPNGPQLMREVWESVTPPDSLQIRYLRQLAEPPASLGIFIEVNTANAGDAPAAIQWCRQLLQNVFPTQPIAIVIHVSGGGPEENTHLVEVLQAQFREGAHAAPASQYPIQPMAWVGANSRQQRQDNAISADPRARMKQRRAVVASPGASLWTELCFVFEKADNAEERTGSLARHSKLLAASDDLERRLAHSGLIKGASLPDQRSVVRDIDEFYFARTPGNAAATAWSHETDSQLISAIRDYFPEFLPELIREYAAGKRREGWRESLLFAAPFDHLMDAWVQGSELGQDRITDDILLPRNGVGVVNALALGILRACRAHQRGTKVSFAPEHAYKVLQQLCQMLSPELVALVERTLRHDSLVLSPEELAELCEEYGESILLLAFRSGICTEPPANFLRNQGMTLNAINFWHYVTRLMPTRELILDLLDAPEVAQGVPARAIFGLMSSDEWRAVLSRNDRQLLKEIVECRGGRPLSTFVRNSAKVP